MEGSLETPDCKDHPTKKIVAICLTPGCHTHLCSGCFASHSEHHSQSGTHMQLNSLEDLKSQTYQKLESMITEAKIRKASFDEFAQLTGPEAIKKEINRLREIVFQIGLDFFNDIENKLMQIAFESTQIRQSRTQLFEKDINRFIQNLHNMADNLKVKSSLVKTVMHVMQKDLDDELDQIHNKCAFPPENISLFKNPGFEHSLLQFLRSNIILLKTEPEKKRDPYQVDIESEDPDELPRKASDVDIESEVPNNLHSKNDDAAQQEEQDNSKPIECNQQ